MNPSQAKTTSYKKQTRKSDKKLPNQELMKDNVDKSAAYPENPFANIPTRNYPIHKPLFESQKIISPSNAYPEYPHAYPYPYPYANANANVPIGNYPMGNPTLGNNNNAFPSAAYPGYPHRYPPVNYPNHPVYRGYQPPSLNYDDDEETGHVNITPAKNQNTSTTEDPETIFQVSMNLKKKVIQASSFGEQTFPMLVSLLGENGKDVPRPPVDLVCVIDRSGSMKGEKIELVKKTFDYLLRYLDDSDRLSIVAFDDNVDRLGPLLRTKEERKTKILAQIKTVKARGGTDISSGMKHAFEILKQRRYKNPVSAIFLLTDGKDKNKPHKVLTNLKSHPSLNDVTIHTFGFGDDHDPQLMNDIADLRDGNFYYVKELEALDKAFVDCLGGLVSSVAQKVEVKIQPEPSEALKGVKIVKAYGDASMWAKQGEGYRTEMLSLISGSKKDFVLEIKIPTTTIELKDHEKDLKIASVEVNIIDLANNHITKKAELRVTLLNETEEVKDDEEEGDREVMTNFFRVKGASLMTEARNLAEVNKHEEARKMLQNFKEELENCFLKNEMFIKNLVEDMRKAIVYVSPQEYQRAGKLALVSNARAQVRQKATFDSANYMQNNVQVGMMEKLAFYKKH